MTFWATAVVIDFAANAIEIHAPALPADLPSRGTLDIGANGRLLGLEIGDAYIQIMESANGEEPYMRSAAVELRRNRNGESVVISRRGPEYEISYPSGNECWQLTTVDGQVVQVCATIAG